MSYQLVIFLFCGITIIISATLSYFLAATADADPEKQEEDVGRNED
jgi:hypothetical protein